MQTMATATPLDIAVPSETRTDKKTHLFFLFFFFFFPRRFTEKHLGFSHAAFVFGYESLVHRGREPGGGVPPGALVSFVQKGLQYLELEANVAEDPGGGGGGPAVRGDFAALTASDLITKDVEELKRAVAERRERGGGAGGGAGPATTGNGSAGGLDGPLLSDAAATRLEGHSSEVFTVAWSPDGRALATGSGDGTARLWNVGSGGTGPTAAAAAGGNEGSAAPAVLSASSILRHTAGGATAAAAAAAAPAPTPGDKTRDVTTLDWSPDGTLLATGSYDGVARLWSAADGALVRSLAGHSGPIFSLKWAKTPSSGSNSPRLLLSGSVDKRAIVWNADSGEVKQEFECHTGEEEEEEEEFFFFYFHFSTFFFSHSPRFFLTLLFSSTSPQKTAPTLDVDWRDATTFASSSTDGTVRVCRLRESEGEGEAAAAADASKKSDVTTLSGHSDEVNAIKWSPTGKLLASASDDGTARLWDADDGTCVRTLTGHSKEVYSVRWAPKLGGSGGSGGEEPMATDCGGGGGGGGGNDTGSITERSSLLATASFDHTVKLWDAETGTSLKTLARHGAPVYSAAFSPDGMLLATGSFDRRVHIWNVSDGELVKTFRGKGGVFEVAWSPDESSGRLAACFSDRSVAVLDLKK